MKNSVQNLKKGQWSREEDTKLIEAVNASKIEYDYVKPEIKALQVINESKRVNWSKVELIFGGDRSQAQCRQRYLNYLSPNIRRGEFSKGEDDAILRMFHKYGSKWSRFREERILKGRTVFSIRSRYRALIRSSQPRSLEVPKKQKTFHKELSSIALSSGTITKKQIILLKKYVGSQKRKLALKEPMPKARSLSKHEYDEKMQDAIDGIILLRQAKYVV